VLPRAFVAHQARAVASDEEALSLMLDPAFDPASEVLLAQPDAASLGPTSGESTATIVSYDPERVEIEASLDSPGYLVLTDAYYPGWTVEVDGVPAPIERADLYFRAVRLEPGEHQVVVTYAPSSAHVGLGIGVAAWVVWGMACIVAVVMIGRKSASSV